LPEISLVTLSHPSITIFLLALPSPLALTSSLPPSLPPSPQPALA
jgi:hypothetical protein